MLFLLVVGLVHAVLLRNGDILAPYAILGLVLYLARAAKSRQLAIAVVVLALLPYAIQLVAAQRGWTFAQRPGGSDAKQSYLGDNWSWLRYWYLSNPLLSWPRILAVMLCGILADRARLLPRLAASRRLSLNVLLVSLPLAVASRAADELLAVRWNPPTLARSLVLNQLYFVAAWSLAATYVAAFALLCQRPEWSDRLSWLRAVGRMAFSNYLIQAIIIVPVCLIFGLFDTVTPARALALVGLVVGVEIPFSVWWLRHHPYGPVESFWRRVTYGRSGTGRSRSASSALREINQDASGG